MQSWGLICGQLCILGDSGTGAAVAVVVAEVVCRYQKGQWKRHEHLYNKAIIWGLNISHSEKTPLLFLLMTVPTKVSQTAKINNCNFLHMFYQLYKLLIRSANELLKKSNLKQKEEKYNQITYTVIYLHKRLCANNRDIRVRPSRSSATNRFEDQGD